MTNTTVDFVKLLRESIHEKINESRSDIHDSHKSRLRWFNANFDLVDRCSWSHLE